MATVSDFTRKGLPPQTHAYDDPTIGPLEFLQCVYRATHLPMSIRIDAARGLLPYTEPRPASHPSSYIGCTIVIGGLGPSDPSPSPGSAHDPTRNHSQNPLSASITLTHADEAVAPVNLTTIPDPSPLPNYSTPPTPEDLQAIKAAINHLRPDLAHLPMPAPHLCGCGHWMFGPCPLGEQCRDRSKLN
jgi:hypothetical protein